MDDDRELNPYAPPRADLRPQEPEPPDTPPGEWRTEPRRVPAVNGLLWWWRAARVVAARPGLWAAALCLTAAVPAVLAVISADLDGDDDEEEIFFMLFFLFWFFWPALTGCIVKAAHKQLRGERRRLRDIFAFFDSLAPLLGWSFVGIFVTLLEFVAIMLLSVALEAALPLTLAANPFLVLALAAIPVTGSMFIAAAVALHDEWPECLNAFFRAGLVNMRAFLLNLPAATLAICAMPLLGLLGGCIMPSRLTQSLTVPEGALAFAGVLSLVTCAAIGAFALVAYAAVRDMFYNEE